MPGTDRRHCRVIHGIPLGVLVLTLSLLGLCRVLAWCTHISQLSGQLGTEQLRHSIYADPNSMTVPRKDMGSFTHADLVRKTATFHGFTHDAIH